MRDKPEENRERDAEEQAGDDRKVERGMFATMNDVAGQFSQAEWQLAPKLKKATNQDEQPSEKDKRAPKLAKGVHDMILPEKG